MFFFAPPPPPLSPVPELRAGKELTMLGLIWENTTGYLTTVTP